MTEKFPVSIRHELHIGTPVTTLPATWARMHHKVVGNFGSEADDGSLYYRR